MISMENSEVTGLYRLSVQRALCEKKHLKCWECWNINHLFSKHLIFIIQGLFNIYVCIVVKFEHLLFIIEYVICYTLCNRTFIQ